MVAHNQEIDNCVVNQNALVIEIQAFCSGRELVGLVCRNIVEIEITE